MSIHVSEPGRPVETRLPEILRNRRVGSVDGSAETQPINTGRNERTDATTLNAEQVTARRAFTEYSQTMESDPESERPYLPVSRIYSEAIITVDATSKLVAARDLMNQHSVHHMVVVAEGSVAGLIDDRWLLGWLAEQSGAQSEQTFSQTELPAFLTASPETDAHQLARLMLAHQLDAALIIDQAGSTLGIVTGTDYLRLYADASRQQSSV
ncbi:MAG: CBS domain-containing protein [Marinobacter sp.]|nr:CBS domain-containing protein [Marinobacter sp.]